MIDLDNSKKFGKKTLGAIIMKKEIKEILVAVTLAVIGISQLVLMVRVFTLPAPVADKPKEVIIQPPITSTVPSVVVEEEPVEYLLNLEGVNEPFPVQIVVLNDTNFFFEITYEVNGEKGVCNYKLLRDKNRKEFWNGSWYQNIPENRGECFVKETGDDRWSAFFQSSIDGAWSSFEITKKKKVR